MIIHAYNFVKRFAQNNRIFPNFVVFKIRFYGQKIFLYPRAVSDIDTARTVPSPRIISNNNLAFPLGGRGTASAVDEGNFIFYSVRKGKLFSESVFPFSHSILFRKLLITPRKVISCSLFHSPLIFKGQRSLVAERI